MLQPSGSSKQIMSFKVTLLPVPLLPRMQNASPAQTSNERSSMTARRLKAFDT